MARNAFNIGEVWNPVCRHGNKTVKLKLGSTLAEISFFIIFDQNLVECDVITWLICIFKKLEYLWNKKKYLKK